MNIPIIGIVSFLLMGVLPFEIKSIDKMTNLKEVIRSEGDSAFSNEYSKNDISDPMVRALNISHSGICKNNDLKFVSQKDLVEESVELIRKGK